MQRSRLFFTHASLLFALAQVLASPALAQSGNLKSLLGTGGTALEVEAPDVLEAASRSYSAAVMRRLGLAEGTVDRFEGVQELEESKRRGLAEEARTRFESRVEYAISELEGDGLLLADEVTRTLESLREEEIATLEEIVEAHVAGYAPPPTRLEFTSDADYRSALFDYVFTVRNSWHGWAILAGATLAGLALAVGVLKAANWDSEERETSRWKSALHPLVDSLHGPLYLLLATSGLAIGLQYLWLPSSFARPAHTTLLLFVVVGVFWMTWRMSATVPGRVGDWITPSGESPGKEILEVARKALRLGLILIFAFLGVEVVFGTDLTALLAGLGLVGLAFTLAAQDTLKDLFAAVTIHVNRPFALGDLVRYAGYFGTIEEIGFRMTRLRTLDGHLVTVPNAKLVADPVENVGARPHVRRRFHLDLPYDTPLEDISKAVEAVREVIQGAGELDPDRDVQVHFDEFGPHSFKLLVQYYYESGDYWAAKAKATEIDLAIVECFRENGIEFAFPTQTLHLFSENEGADEGSDKATGSNAEG